MSLYKFFSLKGRSRPVLKLFLAGLALVLVPLSLLAYYSVFPTGVTRYDPKRAYNSYVLFGSLDGKSHLIDMNGNEIHTWDHWGFPTEMLDPAITGGKLGHILVQLTPGIDHTDGIFRNRTIGELDWDGKVVWEWGEKAPGGTANQNHDWYRLPSGNTLLISSVPHGVPGFAAAQIDDQAIYEVTPAGDIVWKWLASDHLDEYGFSPEGLAYVKKGSGGPGSAVSGFLTINDMHVIGPNKWFRAGDTRFDPENIIIDARNANFTAIIEKKTGKLVWQIGPYYPPVIEAKRPIPRDIDQISGQHDAHLIADGLPGAGDLLLFDNQGDAGFPPAALRTNRGSRVLEIDPSKKQIVWEYSGESSDRPSWSFFSAFISSARRLPNGNTLIDEGMNGRFFQVTPDGDIVWEFVNPHFGRSIYAGVKEVGNPERPVITNWVYRAQPIPYDWVPEGTPHSEIAVVPPDLGDFHIPPSQ